MQRQLLLPAYASAYLHLHYRWPVDVLASLHGFKQNSKLQLWLHAFIQGKKKTEKGTVETKEMNHHRQFIIGDGGWW
jgi:hypothetical protein